ncbi:MAG: YveK family protein [Clostridium sp.]
MLTIKDVLVILKKRLIMITIIVVLSTLAAGVISFVLIKPVYQSSTKLFIGKNQEGSNYENSEVQMYQNLMKTYAEIIQTEDLMQRALENADIDLEANEVLGSLTVIPQDKSQILEMSYKSGDAYDAKNVLYAINDEFIKTSKKLITNGTVEVIKEPKVNITPISPNKKMNVLIAFAMSLMVGVTLSLFLEYLDNSVKTEQDIEKLLGVSVIGMLPALEIEKGKRTKKSSAKKRREKKCLQSKKSQEVSMQSHLGQ